MAKLRTPPPDLSTNSSYSESIAAIIFYAFLKSDQGIENDPYFKKLYKRYRDKIRKQLSHSVQQVSQTGLSYSFMFSLQKTQTNCCIFAD